MSLAKSNSDIDLKLREIVKTFMKLTSVLSSYLPNDFSLYLGNIKFR